MLLLTVDAATRRAGGYRGDEEGGSILQGITHLDFMDSTG